MNLEKATELNKETRQSLSKNHFNDHADAVALGNEAIKAVLKMRHYPFPDEILCLPGETEE